MSSRASLLFGSGSLRPHAALELPRGRLMIGEFVVDFSPEQVLVAAEKVIDDVREGDFNGIEPLFVSQAAILEYSLSNRHYDLTAKTF